MKKSTKRFGVKTSDLVAKPKPKPRPQSKSILEASRGLLRATAKSAGERWITIGSDSSAPAGDKGGTPVMISGDGEILKGPKDLKGENLKDLGKGKGGGRGKPKKKETPPEPEPPEKQNEKLLELIKKRDESLLKTDDPAERSKITSEYREKRKELVGDYEEKFRQWHRDRKNERLQDIRSRIDDLEKKKPWELAVDEYSAIDKIRQGDQAKKDLKKIDELVSEYADAVRENRWGDATRANEKLEATRGWKAIVDRTKDKDQKYFTPRDIKETLENRIERAENAEIALGDWESRERHEKAVREQAEKDIDAVPADVLREYVWKDWMPQKAKDKIDTEDTINRWAKRKDSDDFRRQAREGRKIANLANSAIDTYREQLTQQQFEASSSTKEQFAMVDAMLDHVDREKWDAKLAENDERVSQLSKQAIELYNRKRDLRSLQQQESTQALAAAIKPTEKSKWEIKGVDTLPESQQKEVQKAIDWLAATVAPGVSPGSIEIIPTKSSKGYAGDTDRSFHLNGKVYLTQYAEADTVIHEIGHAIDYANDSKIGKQSVKFLAAKTFDEPVAHLGSGYKSHEVATKNGFLDSYTGKYYDHNSSEILSMGMQHMYQDPVRFAQESPDHFNYTAAIMRGLIE